MTCRAREVLQSRIRAAEVAFKQAEGISKKATAVFDLMLDYPPDWSLRTAAVARRDRECTSCGSIRNLQTHHIVPLSKGGTNKLNNLKLLCESCHQRAHGGRTFSGTKSDKPLAISNRVQLLREAIDLRKDVEFMYQKPTDTSYKKRRVTPYSLTEINHKQGEGQTLCLNGYCHLRRAERSFALKRMKGLKYA
jgi:HNH endonuclease/WYL domain